MTLGKIVLCQRDPNIGNAVDNYRPILCLLLMCKLMIKTIAESISNFIDVDDKLLVKQKGCRKKSRGTKDQLLINKTILHNCRKKHINLGMAWFDYKKAYEMVPNYWILESLEFVKSSNLKNYQRQIGKQS